MTIIYIIAGILILFILGGVILRLFEKPVERSKEFLLRNLIKIVNEKDDDDEFDDFICVPIANSRFEEIRKFCCDITDLKGSYSNYSIAEKEMLNKFISELE